MTDEINRASPAVVEAENALLGALIVDPSRYAEISNILASDDFFVHRNGWVYQALGDLIHQGKPIDFVTLCASLTERGILEEIGGAARLIDLVNSAPNSQHAVAYARIVEENAVRRQVLDASGKIATAALSPDQSLESVVEYAAQVTDIVNSRGEQSSGALVEIHENSSDGYDLALEYASNRAAGKPVGISTGLNQLDIALGGGMKKQKMIVVAARPGQGKSALLQKIGLHALSAGKRVLIWTGEMSNTDYDLRMKCIQAGIDSNKIESGYMAPEEWERYTAATELLSSYHGAIFDAPGISVSALRAKALQMRARGGLDLIVVDYLGLLTGRGKDKNEELSNISRGIKGLSKEFNVPVLTAHQMNRAIESRGEETSPQLSDLRDSGSIEQDADVVMFLHCPPSKMTFKPRPVRLHIQKNRSGKLTTIDLAFVAEYTRFGEVVKM